MKLNKNQIERYSRQIILKDIGPLGQKKLLKASILVVGTGGLGSPILAYLSGAGIGSIGIIDYDKVNISNLHRQILFETDDIKKSKSKLAYLKIKRINPDIKVKFFRKKLINQNIKEVGKDYDILVDGSDNFETKFLINDYCLKNKKILITGSINKYDGHVFTFDFKNNKKTPCLRCFFQTMPSNELLNCEADGILATLAGIVGSIQANEVIKEILNIGNSLCGYILIINSLDLSFRKVKLTKKKNCFCNK